MEPTQAPLTGSRHTAGLQLTHTHTHKRHYIPHCTTLHYTQCLLTRLLTAVCRYAPSYREFLLCSLAGKRCSIELSVTTDSTQVRISSLASCERRGRVRYAEGKTVRGKWRNEVGTESRGQWRRKVSSERKVLKQTRIFHAYKLVRRFLP